MEALISLLKAVLGMDLFVTNRELDTNEVHCYCLGLDVVEYSKKTADIQYKINLRLKNIVLNAIALKYLDKSKIIYLPTGDGLIICLLGSSNTALCLIELAREIHQTLKRVDDAMDNDEMFAIRMGLHSGTGVMYNDINERSNIAGNVINMTQRIMDMGQEWHILATKAAFDDIGGLNKNTKKYFQTAGFGETKHKETIEVFNVYQIDENEFGNKERPVNVRQAYNTVETKISYMDLTTDISDEPIIPK